MKRCWQHRTCLMMRPEIFTASGRNIRPSWQNWPPTRTGWTKLIRYVDANFLSVYETTVILGTAIQGWPLTFNHPKFAHISCVSNRRDRPWWQRSLNWSQWWSRPSRICNGSGRSLREPPRPRPNACLMLTEQSSLHRAALLWMSGWKTSKVSCKVTTMEKIWPASTSCLRSTR